MTLSAIVKDLDKTVRTATGTKDFLDQRQVLQRKRAAATQLSDILLDLRFQESGIRSEIKAVLLRPSREAAAQLERELNKRLELVKQTITRARSDKEFAAQHSTLIDKVMVTIQEPKVKFYQAILDNESKFRRALEGYLTNPNSVSLHKRRQIAEELDTFFERINKEILETRQEIAEFLKQTD